MALKARDECCRRYAVDPWSGHLWKSTVIGPKAQTGTFSTWGFPALSPSSASEFCSLSSSPIAAQSYRTLYCKKCNSIPYRLSAPVIASYSQLLFPCQNEHRLSWQLKLGIAGGGLGSNLCSAPHMCWENSFLTRNVL